MSVDARLRAAMDGEPLRLHERWDITTLQLMPHRVEALAVGLRSEHFEDALAPRLETVDSRRLHRLDVKSGEHLLGAGDRLLAAR